ncbi:hypothetical protein [Clostridium sp.]|nr:hypothetical protein [Clostridium sp.]
MKSAPNINDDGSLAIFNIAEDDIEKIKEDWKDQEINNNLFNNFEARQYD